MNQTINLGIEGLDITFSIEETTEYNYETRQREKTGKHLIKLDLSGCNPDLLEPGIELVLHNGAELEVWNGGLTYNHNGWSLSQEYSHKEEK